MRKKWNIFPGAPHIEKELSQGLGCSPILARLLTRRGFTTVSSAKFFLHGSLSDLHSPQLLPDIEKACLRIRRAIDKGEKILIYGDYDVDGQTSIAILMDTLKGLGGDVSYYIPNRVEEGYGLKEEPIQEAKEKGVSLIITVDCGSTAVKEAALCKDLGLDLIITDHHEFRDEMPDALAFINAHRRDSDYPDKGLAGVGVAFKLAQALLGVSTCAREGIEDKRLYSYLDLVALGTIADVVPLQGESRIFAKEGLKVLTETQRAGLIALKEVAGVKGKIRGYHVGFIFGPRLNAAGRISDAGLGVQLLLSKNKSEAEGIARLLDGYNRERQAIEKKILSHAVSRIDKEINLKEESVIVLADKDWHPGVIGIVASRLLDKFYRPVILIALKEDIGRGSGRSFGGFHLFQALEELKSRLVSFGGHRYAAGLNILPQEIANFKKEINSLARTTFTEEDTVPVLDVDAEISFTDIEEPLVDELALLHPHGSSNPGPVFISRDIEVVEKPRLVGNRHLKFFLRGNGRLIHAIGFGLGNREDLNFLKRAGAKIDLAYLPEENNYLGIKSIELKIKDVTPSSLFRGRDNLYKP